MTVTVRSDGTIDAAAHGVLPTNQDNTAALQALLTEYPPGSMICLGAGNYRLSATVDAFTGGKGASHVDQLRIRGCGTSISGNFNGPLVAYNKGGVDASASVHVSGITFNNSLGSGLRIERTDRCTIRDCTFSGLNGLIIGGTQNSNYEVSVTDCDFQGDLRTYPNGIGCAVNGNGLITNGKATGWDVGYRLCRGMSILRGRMENCNTGLMLGFKPDGTPISTTACTFTSMYSEANVLPIRIVKSCYGMAFTGLNVLGSGNTVTGQPPLYGLNHDVGAGPLLLQNVNVGGAFQTAAISLRGDGPVTLVNTTAAVKNAPGQAWDVTTPAASITKIQSNCP